MKFTLIICTYHRAKPLLKLLNSVEEQTLFPDQILIIDGSRDEETWKMLEGSSFSNLEYFKIPEENRGLTKQRNFGIRKVAKSSEIVCFLDDDIVLTPPYFENLINTYTEFPDALGVGGYIIEEVKWERTENNELEFDEFQFSGWKRKLGSRNVLRKKLNLLSNEPPGYMPKAGNGFSTGFLPPSGKIYPVEFFMGGVASYKKKLFKLVKFSEYFEGYGLYEDMDLCLRASQVGQLYVNTDAQLYHNHEEGGRPNKFKYGKMVVRNGWYVWRVKFQNPPLKAKFKWHATACLLTLIRIGNVLTTSEKKSAFTESMGRIWGWWSLLWDKPKVQL
ncbi:glycosyltransferase family 2 protein [Autumnicola psychrophila]|uniref:Glycosyltransferase n=1 Tax=Autumnicola psychrophila TaxID=3075592 RepID=A0ABU3DSZ7_9FLAO|nr:glycosyltransferase [Zunongwangia sp. F225]MDT0686837.1 glycosyltransferase [Zunongwangia sp. F225]